MSDTKATGGIEVSRSDDEVMVMARKRLRLALEMLGSGAADAVLDESLTGAGILAHDTGDPVGGALRAPGVGGARRWVTWFDWT